MGGFVHLTKRFVGSLDPRSPSATDVTWVHDRLLPGEIAVWDAMSRPDRRHSLDVARRTVTALGSDASRPVVAAALLHDCGKVTSGLGTFSRVAATLVVAAVGRVRVTAWADRDGVRGRIGRYAAHPRLGRQLLVEAGSDPLTSAWAAEHHLPPAAWTVPRSVGAVLTAADDD